MRFNVVKVWGFDNVGGAYSHFLKKNSTGRAGFGAYCRVFSGLWAATARPCPKITANAFFIAHKLF